MSLTYTEFIRRAGKNEFRKCLNNELKHHNFQYKIGLNEDTIPFDTSDSYKPGGLYFTTKEHINEYLGFGLNVAILELCEDAEFYIDLDVTEFKTNKFIIKEILPQTEELYKIAVQQNPFSLECVTNQTEELCMIAVQQTGLSLKHVKNQTEELCMLAVQQHGYALQFVINQTPEFCKMAIQQNPLSLKFVREKTEELCKLAAQQKVET
jgi:hypothetical protein